jgi:predicted transcriptional regulator
LPLLGSYFRAKRHAKLLASYNRTSFGAVLRDKELYTKFKALVAEDLAIENCLFWEQYQKIRTFSKRRFSKRDPVTRKAEVVKRLKELHEEFLGVKPRYGLRVGEEARQALLVISLQRDFEGQLLELEV